MNGEQLMIGVGLVGMIGMIISILIDSPDLFLVSGISGLLGTMLIMSMSIHELTKRKTK